MPRLAIAIIAAFGLHLLLLMTILPERQYVKPEFKGSGHVTVNIARPSFPVQKTKSEHEPEPERDTRHKLVEQQMQVAEQIQTPVTEPPVQHLEPKKKKTTIHKESVAEDVGETKETRDSDLSKTIHFEETISVENEQPSENNTSSSAVETLRYPEPVKSSNEPPSYPSLARKRGWQGTVLLEVDVQRDGIVKSVKVKQGSGYELLNKEALTAVRKWRFSPGYESGVAVPMKVLVPIHFILQDA